MKPLVGRESSHRMILSLQVVIGSLRSGATDLPLERSFRPSLVPVVLYPPSGSELAEINRWYMYIYFTGMDDLHASIIKRKTRRRAIIRHLR
jgi:hypothetical protein